ncbi:MarR family winged helix-turn-helix transcriptional regulator [Hydrogenispora ethanolica]|nr:MarR family transcriptional regulator [Hydrogenispora ethanolica]
MSNYNEAMNTSAIISLISNIREKANRFIIQEMAEHDIKGLVPSHGDILYALFQRDALTMTDLAKTIDRDKSTVTALVDKLIGLGYVLKIKETADNRVSFVKLTDRGRALKPALDAISGKLLDQAYRDISAAERQCLIELLSKIQRNF